MSAILAAEQACRELGERQRRTQEVGVALGYFCRDLELRGLPHDVATEFYRFARRRIEERVT